MLENTGDMGVYQIAVKQMQEIWEENRFGRKINVVMERFKFYSRVQKADETIDLCFSAKGSRSNM